MATYTYDDGSTISNDQTPTGWVTTSTPAPDSYFAQDYTEQKKYGQAYPQNGMSFGENAAIMGISKLFDAHIAKVNADAYKSVQPTSYAGQNGRTYQAGRPAGEQFDGGVSPLVLLLIAGAVVFAVVS